MTTMQRDMRPGMEGDQSAGHDLDLKAGASVYTAKGKRVGSIERVVLDPSSLETTHLVVEKGLLSVKERLVPVEAIGIATSERITLDEGVDIDSLEPFEVERYIPIDPSTRGERRETAFPAMLSYPPLGMTTMGAPSTMTTLRERTIADDMVALEAGTEVISFDEEVVGTLQRVLTTDDVATHIVVEAADDQSSLKAVPAGWIADLHESGPRLSVEGWIVGELPDYEPDEE